MPKTLLPDVNVWLALTFDSHVHYPPAKIWFDGLTDELCFFCRTTQQGFLRLATNRPVSGPHALTLDEAWQAYDGFQSDPHVFFADEPAMLETHWRSFTRGQAFSNQVWTDAYIAAFAQAGGFEVVTFDKGFRKYQNLACIILP
jgi:toxin-antitoxin system PIN domain toxin